MPELTTKIPIRDRTGRVIDEKEIVTFAGLLHKAHAEGLRSIKTEVVVVPIDGNDLAVVHATVEMPKGVFTGIGDASSSSVNSNIVPHIVRMAETRAKARALRDALDIGVVALEELRGESDLNPGAEPGTNLAVLPHLQRDWRADPMSDAQRRLLFRLLGAQGHEGEEAVTQLLEHTGVNDIGAVTKAQASELIDKWKNDATG